MKFLYFVKKNHCGIFFWFTHFCCRSIGAPDWLRADQSADVNF